MPWGCSDQYSYLIDRDGYSIHVTGIHKILQSIRLRNFSLPIIPFISALVSLGILALYLSIAPTRLSKANFGSDGGDLLAAVLTLGIPHPTGYPTYTLLGRLFQLVPLSTPVFRAALESLVPASLAAGLLTAWMCFVLGSPRPVNLGAAIVASTAWGVAPLLFSQSVIIDVHGLQSLFIMLILWWATLNLDHAPGRYVKWLLGLSFLVGLGLGNHLTLVLFAPAAVFAIIYMVIRSRDWKLVLAQVSLVILGLLVYLYLPLRAHAYPAINWGNPQTWSGFLWEVTANPYQGLLFHTATPVLLDRIRSISNLLIDQFGVLGLIAGAVGVIQYSFRIKWLRWVLVWTFLMYFAFSIGYNTRDSTSYLIPATMIYAIWIGLSVPSFINLSWKKIPFGVILALVLAISIWIRIPATRARLDPRLQDQPARYAELLLKQAPVNAIVYTITDQDTFPLWYYHFGLGQRSDLRLVVLSLTQFVWYQQSLSHTYTDLAFPALYSKDQPNADWGKQIASMNPGRPVCNTKLSNESDTGIEFQCTSP